MNKNFRIFLARQSLIGDVIMSTPMLNYFERLYPGSYKVFHLARKCSQMAPLLFNHPLIDKLLITDCDEGFGPNDYAEMAKCDIVINTMPPHESHSSHDWPQNFNIYEETWIMAGLPLEEYHKLPPEEQRPKLVKWFNVEPSPKTIALWPCAGYGVENKRNPSQSWYKTLVEYLNTAGYRVLQFGHPRDFTVDGSQDMRHLGFFEQIKMSVGCDLAITTDSGSGLILGAYEMKQISLLTNHFPGHTRNLEAFAPNNPFNTNFVGVGGADNISQRLVVDEVLNKLF